MIAGALRISSVALFLAVSSAPYQCAREPDPNRRVEEDPAEAVYKLAERPGARELTEIGERWRPYRTVATWYVWRRAAQIVAESKPKALAKALTTASAPRASRRK